jgi:acetyltransferase-like isoleucine patch superfamily enzyme
MCEEALVEIAAFCDNITVVIGLPIQNSHNTLSAAAIIQNRRVVSFVTKHDVERRDEAAYLTAGDGCEYFFINGHKVAVVLGHDIASTDFVRATDTVIFLDADRWRRRRIERRYSFMAEKSFVTERNIVYANQLGGNTDTIYDGSSAVFNYKGEAIPYDKTYVVKPVTIGSCVWVGAYVILLPGTTIGDGAIIQAGSVVHGEIPPLAIAGGNPAKVFAWRDKEQYDAHFAAGLDHHGGGINVRGGCRAERLKKRAVLDNVLTLNVHVRELRRELQSGRIDVLHVGAVLALHKFVRLARKVDVDRRVHVCHQNLRRLGEGKDVIPRHIDVPHILARKRGEYDIENDDHRDKCTGECGGGTSVAEALQIIKSVHIP